FGYRTAMRVSGALVCLSTLLVAWLVQERRRAALTTRTSMLDDVRTGLRHPVMRIVMAASALATLGSVGIQPILTLYLEQLGAHQEWVSGVVFSIPGIAFVLFASRWTRLGEARGFDRTLAYGFAGSALGGVLLALMPGLYAFSGAYLWFGLFSAAVGPSCAALISQHVDSGFAGRAFSLQQSANMAGGLLGPITAGFIAGRFGPSATFWLTAVVFAGGIFWVLRLAARWRTGARSSAAVGG
ncbi:MAG TPA: MFS transporter, partial [Limnochordia bacterium]|nr:MFS transporter [Limnochordia bacterium]